MFSIMSIILAGIFLAFLATETVFSARKFPKTKFWRLRGGLAAITYLTLATYSPFLWSGWLNGPVWFDIRSLPLWSEVLIGYGAIQFVAYWWHRAMHESDVLWRVFHQMHHSVERMDVWGSLYLHPFDMVGFTFMASFALTMIVGISPMAASITAMIGLIAAVFTHCNIRTPRWIGYIIERPEGHGRHHERERHNSNYAELTIWDQLFGTFDNPREWNGRAGFYDGASGRIWEMLTFQDVSKPKSAIPDKIILDRRVS